MAEEVSALESEMKRLSVSTIKKLKIPKIAIIWHPDCELHYIPNHPEKPQRVEGILKTLHKFYPSDIFFEAPLVTEEQILDFHSSKHLDLFLAKYQEYVENKLKNEHPFGKWYLPIVYTIFIAHIFVFNSFF